MTFLVDLITHSAALTSLVIVIAIALFIIEAFSPHTFGLVGVIGVMIISALLYAYQAAGVGYWFGPIAVIIGVAFVAIEAVGGHFHGILMMTGAAATGIGMFFALGAGSNAGMATTAGIIATFCAMYCAFKVLPLSTFWRKSGSGNTLQLPEPRLLTSVAAGTKCITTSDLRPCGMVLIGEHQYPARSIEGFTRSGTQVTVRAVRNHEVLVTVESQ